MLILVCMLCRLKYLELEAVKDKTAAMRVQMKNLVDEACFQVEIPVITTKRVIESGEQLFVDYTGGKKNSYLLSAKKIAQLISEGKIAPSQVSSCLESAGRLCSCGRFFIIPPLHQQVSLSALPQEADLLTSTESSAKEEDSRVTASPQHAQSVVENAMAFLSADSGGVGEAGIDLLLSPPSLFSGDLVLEEEFKIQGSVKLWFIKIFNNTRLLQSQAIPKIRMTTVSRFSSFRVRCPTIGKESLRF